MKSLIKKVAVSSLLTLGAMTNSFAESCTGKNAVNCYALIINNYDYEKPYDLVNTRNDGTHVKEQLTEVGFSVKHSPNIKTKQDFDGELEAFVTAAKNEAKTENSFALVYYSGHGVNEDRESFLLPTDINNLISELTHAGDDKELRLATLKKNALSIKELIFKLKGVLESNKFQGILLMIDACQNEVKLNTTDTRGNKQLVLNRKRNLSKVVMEKNIGITFEEFPRGMFLAYAAKPATASKDTVPELPLVNSLYTSQFLDLLKLDPSPALPELIIKLENQVIELSNKANDPQEPFSLSSTDNPFKNFYFNPPQEFEPYTPKKF